MWRIYPVIIAILIPFTLLCMAITFNYATSDRITGYVTEVYENRTVLIVAEAGNPAYYVKLPTLAPAVEVGDKLQVWFKRGAYTAIFPGNRDARIYIKRFPEVVYPEAKLSERAVIQEAINRIEGTRLLGIIEVTFNTEEGFWEVSLIDQLSQMQRIKIDDRTGQVIEGGQL